MADIPEHIFELYPELPLGSRDLITIPGGLSGACLWKLQAGASKIAFAVRKWPAGHPTFDQLSWIHRVITHAIAAGCQFLSVPLTNRQGQTISRIFGGDRPHDNADRADAEIHSTLWEVSTWMPGSADFVSDPNPRRLTNMMHALARFHLAAAQVTFDFHASQNIQRRLDLLKELALPATLEQLKSARFASANTVSNEPDALHVEVHELKRLFLQCAQVWIRRLLRGPGESDFIPSLRASSILPAILPIQPVLRDIWHDHVLFTGDEVTGVIDYGAMQMDSVAFDIARLLGSTVMDDSAKWQEALAAYCQFRPLTEAERKLLPWIDQTGVFIGSYHWLKWLLLEPRRFQNLTLVRSRVSFHTSRLHRLASQA